MVTLNIEILWKEAYASIDDHPDDLLYLRSLSKHPKVDLCVNLPVNILSGLAPVEAFQLFERACKNSKKLVNVQAWDEASLQLCQPDQVFFGPMEVDGQNMRPFPSSWPTADQVYWEPGMFALAEAPTDSNVPSILGAPGADQPLQDIPTCLLGPGGLDEDLVRWILQPTPQQLTSQRRKRGTLKAKRDGSKNTLPGLQPKSATESDLPKHVLVDDLPASVCYRDIKLFYLRDLDSKRDVLCAIIDFWNLKGHPEGADGSKFFMHGDYQLAYCPINQIISLAFRDGAFLNTDLTPELIWRLRVPKRRQSLDLRWKPEILDTLLRRLERTSYGYELHKSLPMTYDSSRQALQALTSIKGTKQKEYFHNAPVLEVDKQIKQLLGQSDVDDCDADTSEDECCELAIPEYVFPEQARLVENFYGPEAECFEADKLLARRIQVTKDMVALSQLCEPNRRGNQINWDIDDDVDDDEHEKNISPTGDVSIVDLSSEGQATFQLAYTIYKDQKDQYEKQREALNKLQSWMMRTVASRYRETCFGYEKDIKEWYNALKEQVGSNEYDIKRDIKDAYRRSVKPLSKIPKDVELWITNWEQTMAKGLERDLSFATNIDDWFEDFLTAVNLIIPSWTEAYRLTKSIQVEEGTLSYRTLANDFRKAVKASRPDAKSRVAKGSFGPTFAGQGTADESSDSSINSVVEKRVKTGKKKTGKQSSQSTQDAERGSQSTQNTGRGKRRHSRITSLVTGSGPKCRACNQGHELQACYYIFPNKAPDWFTPKTSVQQRVEEKLKNDHGLTEEVKRLQKSMFKGKEVGRDAKYEND
ncbi:uncharacterized protein CDV56_106148 [Aspergillus thermomutatus]|uniref:Uncharacterized protein n=1 Tax=Aspergillus thermomutatus TaxID=41047 RepID=A0A397GKN1_ASPTH|nr:uncharacterized protein CDV56_106148 [Aspergillus thermomutatus]RHZ51562.1 hypothetical protein CDV56_106148 [Aspergillus thermomutatus]